MLRLDQLARLSSTEVCIRVGVTALLPLGPDNLRACSVSEAGKFIEAVLCGPTLIGAGFNRNEEGSLGARGDVEHSPLSTHGPYLLA
jgi:hypothetical protein